MTYNPDLKARCVALLHASGYPNKAGAIAEVARTMGVSRSAVRKWYVAAGAPPGPAPADIVKAERSLTEAVRAELVSIFQAMNTTRDKASYKELAITAGILIDKLQLIQGQATSRVETITRLLDGLSPDEYAAVLDEANDILSNPERWSVAPPDDEDTEKGE